MEKDKPTVLASDICIPNIFSSTDPDKLNNFLFQYYLYSYTNLMQFDRRVSCKTGSLTGIFLLMNYVSTLLDAVHTGGESPQDGLGVVWTCGTTLASAYVLHCLSAT